MAKPRTDTKFCMKADTFGLRCSGWVTTGHLRTKKIEILALAVGDGGGWMLVFWIMRVEWMMR